MEKDYFVDKTAIVDDGARIGKGTKIWHFSHIAKGAKIGRDCKIGQNVYVGPDVNIGNNVKIQNNVSVYPAVTLEDNVFCGPSMVFTNVMNPRCEIVRNSMDFYGRTLVKTGASIGANVTIVCGHTIGRYAFIGAGSVVTKNVPDYALIYGNPAKHHGWMCECGYKINFKGAKGSCSDCNKKYVKRQGKVSRF